MQQKFEQLDLFGFPVEQPKQARKKASVAKSETSAETDAKPEEELPVTAATAGEPELIYAPEVIAEPIPVVAEEPAILEQVMLNTPAVAVVKTTKNPSIIKTPGKRGRKSFREMDSEVDLIEVPDDTVLEQKLYYSISEVAGWFKVNTSLLRFWENEFDILQPRKTRKGDRLFRVEDIKNLQLIYFLLRQRKFSIDGAKKYLKNNKKEADTHAQLVQSLNKFKSFLLELKTNLAG